MAMRPNVTLDRDPAGCHIAGMWKLAVVALLVASVAFADKKPTVSVGTVQVVVGTFDVAPATKIAKTAQAKVLKCYADRGGSATATAKLKLAVDGKVSSVTVTGLASSETDPVQNCIADVLANLKFAAPKDGAVVDLSIAFTFQGGEAIYGGLLDEAGEMNGGFGFGRAGFGPGGGGTGWGTIGTGRYGTIGHGAGKGSGFGVGGSRASVPIVTIGQGNTQGDLDKAIIRRYIRRNIQKFQYCYEKALLATPKLAGTVTAQFTIASSGNVTASTGSGMKNPNVEGCVAAVIKAIEFPKPAAGDVLVTYPFTFKPAPPAPKPKKK
jgi:hypothetical protein